MLLWPMAGLKSVLVMIRISIQITVVIAVAALKIELYLKAATAILETFSLVRTCVSVNSDLDS